MVCDMEGNLDRQLTDCWYPEKTDAYLRRPDLRHHVGEITDWMDQNYYENAMRSPTQRFNFTWVTPTEFGDTPLEHVWEAMYDIYGERSAWPLFDSHKTLAEVEAALLVGNLVCRVGIQRPEVWYCYRQYMGSTDKHSRSYVLAA
jgi:hypothetical protein